MQSFLAVSSPGRLYRVSKQQKSGSPLCRSARVVRGLSALAVGFLGVGALHAQCPQVGNAQTCGFVITVTDAGVATSATGQPTYNAPSEGGDFSVGTLIGVINNSSAPISTLNIGSSLQVFYFTQNGITSYGVPGNPYDQTGYGGPNAYFSDIDTLRYNGTVHFITPVAAGGGTTFFALANNLIAPTPCINLINDAVARPTTTTGTDILSTFTPKQGNTLAQAGAACGFTSFNWQQLVTNLPEPSPFFTAEFENLVSPAPFSDPPPNGYTYQSPHLNKVILPVYYNIFVNDKDDPLSLVANQTSTTLSFSDNPANPCLFGSVKNSCGYTAPQGAKVSFQTHLVGVIGNDVNAVVQDTGIGFTWTSDFNGTSGGSAALNNSRPVDAGSGTGGVTITGYNGSSNYRFPKSLKVTAVNGKSAGPTLTAKVLGAPTIRTTASGLAYSRATRTFTGTVTVRNNTSAPINGPFQLVLVDLTQGATLINATGVFAGSPFLSIPDVRSLSAGDSFTVPVRFTNPAMTAIRFSPAAYTGGFN